MKKKNLRSLVCIAYILSAVLYFISLITSRDTYIFTTATPYYITFGERVSWSDYITIFLLISIGILVFLKKDKHAVFLLTRIPFVALFLVNILYFYNYGTSSYDYWGLGSSFIGRIGYIMQFVSSILMLICTIYYISSNKYLVTTNLKLICQIAIVAATIFRILGFDIIEALQYYGSGYLPSDCALLFGFDYLISKYALLVVFAVAEILLINMFVENSMYLKEEITESEANSYLPVSASKPDTSHIADELMQLKKLLDMEVITQEEFDTKKKELLDK